MKNIFLFIGFVFFTLITTDISAVRVEYRNAADNHEKAIELYKDLTSISESDNALLVGYKGASATLMAKYAKGVKAKTKYFKEGKKLIEQAIATTPENVELRYIRLSVQENAPKIVRYRKNIPEDKQFLLDNYKSVKDAGAKQYIKGFISQSTSFSDAEKELF